MLAIGTIKYINALNNIYKQLLIENLNNFLLNNVINNESSGLQIKTLTHSHYYYFFLSNKNKKYF